MEREGERAREGRLVCCTFLWHFDGLSPRSNGQEQRFTLDRWYFSEPVCYRDKQCARIQSQWKSKW